MHTKPPTRHPHALSARTQRRILSSLRKRALDGDVAASEALLRLAMDAGREPATSLLAGERR
jgi:hypothetical protein